MHNDDGYAILMYINFLTSSPVYVGYFEHIGDLSYELECY